VYAGEFVSFYPNWVIYGWVLGDVFWAIYSNTIAQFTLTKQQ